MLLFLTTSEQQSKELVTCHCPSLHKGLTTFEQVTHCLGSVKQTSYRATQMLTLLAAHFCPMRGAHFWLAAPPPKIEAPAVTTCMRVSSARCTFPACWPVDEYGHDPTVTWARLALAHVSTLLRYHPCPVSPLPTVTTQSTWTCKPADPPTAPGHAIKLTLQLRLTLPPRLILPLHPDSNRAEPRSVPLGVDVETGHGIRRSSLS